MDKHILPPIWLADDSDGELEMLRSESRRAFFAAWIRRCRDRTISQNAKGLRRSQADDEAQQTPQIKKE
jgi:hypothetical protein